MLPVIRPTLTAAAALTFAMAGLATVGTVVVAPAAHASGCSLLGGSTSNGTTVTVTGSVDCSSSSGVSPGSGGSGSLPPCWLAPRYTGKALWDNFHGNVDNIGFLAIPRLGQAEQHKNDPPSQGVWWVPVSNGTAAGNSCAYALYWPEWGPPPGQGTPPRYPVMNTAQASAMARKHLKLPALGEQINPRRRSIVNLPTWVYTARYQNPVSATATISIPVLGMGMTYSVSATVTGTLVGGLHISVPAGSGTVTDGGCGAYGSDSQNGGLTCGVTFTEPSPSATTPFPVKVTTNWHITGPGVDTYASDSDTAYATVAEIQALN
jgi:hypothetical protein